jgi:hypothetical protein
MQHEAASRCARIWWRWTGLNPAVICAWRFGGRERLSCEGNQERSGTADAHLDPAQRLRRTHFVYSSLSYSPPQDVQSCATAPTDPPPAAAPWDLLRYSPLVRPYKRDGPAKLRLPHQASICVVQLACLGVD